jgi:hypothetical protein
MLLKCTFEYTDEVAQGRREVRVSVYISGISDICGLSGKPYDCWTRLPSIRYVCRFLHHLLFVTCFPSVGYSVS